MDCRVFEITVVSATNLDNFPGICRMKVYARVSIGNGPELQKRTPTDHHGSENPAWNYTIKHSLSESMVQHYSTMLVVKLFNRRRLACDRYVGEVHTPMKELFEYAASGGGSAVLSLPVQRGSVLSQGEIKFSYRFGEKVAVERMLLAESVAGFSPR